MNSIFLDALVDDDKRRELLYRGQLLVYSPTPSSLKLVNFARKMAEEALQPYEPETAQYHFPVERYAAILADSRNSVSIQVRPISMSRGCAPRQATTI